MFIPLKDDSKQLPTAAEDGSHKRYTKFLFQYQLLPKDVHGYPQDSSMAQWLVRPATTYDVCRYLRVSV